MNIFFLDEDPHFAAMSHCDKHVVKMIIETAQLLSTAHHELNPDRCPTGIYKSSHKNHPSAIWVRAHIANYVWTHLLLCALCEEYTFRYGKVHATERLIEPLRAIPHGILRGQIDIMAEMTPPPQCMPEEFKGPDTVAAYRAYYKGAKADIARWSKARSAPAWWDA